MATAQGIAIPRQQLFLTFAGFILMGLCDSVLGILIPSIRETYKIDAATVSTLFLFQACGYMIATFNTGILVQRLGMRRFLLSGLLMMTLGTSIVATRIPYWPAVLIGGMCLSFGIGIIDAGLNAYLAGFPESGTSLNFSHAFYGVGALVGPIVASTILILFIPWNWVYALLSCIIATVFMGFWFLYRTVSQPTAKSQTTNVSQVYHMRIVWLAAFCLLAYLGIEISMGNWSFTYLSEFRNIPVKFAGWTVGGYWTGLTLGRALLARRITHVGETRMITECLVGVAVGYILVLVLPSGIGIALGLWSIGFFLGPIFPTMIALISHRVAPNLLAGAVGFMTSLGAIGGAFFPWLAGNIIQRIGLAAFLPYCILIVILLCGCWIAICMHPSRTVVEAAVPESDR
jgi:fucose permease